MDCYSNMNNHGENRYFFTLIQNIVHYTPKNVHSSSFMFFPLLMLSSTYFVMLPLKITCLLIIVFCSLHRRCYRISLCCPWRSPLSSSLSFVLSFIDITTMHFIVLSLKTAPLLSSPFVLLSFVNVTAYAFRCIALEGHHLSLLVIAFCSLLCQCYRIRILLCCTWRSPLSSSSPLVLSFVDITTFIVLHLKTTTSLLVFAFTMYAFGCVAQDHLSPCSLLCR